MMLEVSWDGLWTPSFGLSQFHGHGSWLVCEVALGCDENISDIIKLKILITIYGDNYERLIQIGIKLVAMSGICSIHGQGPILSIDWNVLLKVNVPNLVAYFI